MTITDLIKAAARERGMSIAALCAASGLTRQTLFYWKKGRSPELSSLRKMAAALEMPLEIFLEWDGSQTPETVLAAIHSSTSTVEKETVAETPNRASDKRATKAVEAVDKPHTPEPQVEWIETFRLQEPDVTISWVPTKPRPLPASFFKRHHISPKDCAIITITGNAMAPTLLSGDEVIVLLEKDPRCPTLLEGEIYLYSVDSVSAIRRLHQRASDQTVILTPDNQKNYETLCFPGDAIGDTLHVWGRVVHLCSRSLSTVRL